MSWLRLDENFSADGKVRKCRAVLWWPLILCAMKRGGGVASDDDIAPDVLADIGQGDEAAAASAVERLKAAGLLVTCEGGWTTPNWAKMQPDPTASDRQRAWRDRNRQASESVTVTDRYVTERNGDVTSTNGPKRSVTPDVTGRDGTGQNETTTESPCRGGSTSPARESGVAPEAPTHEVPDGLRDVVDAFQVAAKRGGTPATMRTVRILSDLVIEFGPRAVLEGIEDAADRDRMGGITTAFLVSVLRGRGVTPAGGYRHAKSEPYRDPNGVAQPRAWIPGQLPKGVET